jgi:catechol 2,3-dioxygenase-like lactoylglutathione lyase family enzyme
MRDVAWYARPVLFVTDIERSLDFYVGKLSFKSPWRYEEEARPRVAQVDRDGCELILSSQWPDKTGKGLMFVSLNHDAFAPLRAEFESKGVKVTDGWWGYPVLVVGDPDGNQLYFPHPDGSKVGAPAGGKEERAGTPALPGED